VVQGSKDYACCAAWPGLQLIMVAFHIENYWANRCLTFTMLLRLLRLVQLMRRLFVDSLVASGTSGLSRSAVMTL